MISIIVDNYNRSYLLPLVMRAYRQCSYDDVEMVIVDDASDPRDHFVEYLKLGLDTIKPPYEVRAFETHKSVTMNVGGAINVGVKQSRGDLLILNHSDTIPLNNGVLDMTWKKHQERDWMVLYPVTISCMAWHKGKPTIDVQSKTFIVNFARIWELPSSCSMPRKMYYALGGHDEEFIGSTSVDTDLALRIRTMVKKGEWFMKKDPNVIYLHLDPASVGCRSSEKNPRNDQLVLEHQQKGMVRVNPNGWGEIDTLEEVIHYKP